MKLWRPPVLNRRFYDLKNIVAILLQLSVAESGHNKSICGIKKLLNNMWMFHILQSLLRIIWCPTTRSYGGFWPRVVSLSPQECCGIWPQPTMTASGGKSLFWITMLWKMVSMYKTTICLKIGTFAVIQRYIFL